MNEHETQLIVEDTTPPDEAARRRIRTDLDATLFVAAGAGSGKTASLVDRIVQLVSSGVEIGAIAAITFTEKAAAELRHRVRQRLAQAVASATDLFDHDRYQRALDDLDHAPIGTLHAFARRLLNEFPVAAGLPPGFTVLDELESSLAFDERWDDLLDSLLDEPYPPAGSVAGGVEFVQLCNFDGFGVNRGLRRVAIEFHENWDLVERHVDRSDPPAWTPDPTALLAALDSACSVTAPPNDRQSDLLVDLARAADDLRAATTTIAVLAGANDIVDTIGKPQRVGNKSNWKAFGGPDALEDLRQREAEVISSCEQVLEQARAHRRRLFGTVVGRWVLASAQQRAIEGTVEFHDLLVLARQLVARHADIRAALHRRYRRLLLDEFQDTDPIQLEIAVRLAADPADPAQDDDWTELRPLPGRLFIVGDPKQSIYRFRRADIAQYLGTAGQIGAEEETLSANFRSSQPVIQWINEVFARLITFQPDAQPEYQALDACRPAHRQHGSVHVIGVDEHVDLAELRSKAEELRWREAADAAQAVATALHERWQVSDPNGDLRECRPGDITILLPARTSLAALESALVERDIPYRAENSSVVYVTTEIRHVMLALRAADDPTDELALVATLRTGLYGCSDVELYEWKSNGGSWSIHREPPPGLDDHPVALALTHLRSLAERATWSTPADLISALVDERRLLDAALDAPDARDVWRRIRFVVEQARAWSDAGGHGLRRYLAWVRLQATESHTADTILPEHDYDAVRIMTIHAAKGLEFPITVVTGLTTVPAGKSRNTVVWHRDDWTIASQQGDELYDDFKPIDEQMSDAERRRLLYVACTRAIDHLVVSLHRVPAKEDTADNRLPSGALLALAGAADPATGATPLRPNPGAFALERMRPDELPWNEPGEWAAERERALRTAGRRLTVSATRLAEDLAGAWADPGEADDEGLQKAPVDLELPPWQRGRYGTSVGRAVHGVLQFCDLDTGADIADLAKAQCAAEGIIGLEDTVAALARSALAATIVRDAITREHHRELFVASVIGDRVLEGYVDLLVRTEPGWLIVDYKTDNWKAGADRSERIARYRNQLAAYALALESVLGEPIVGGVLVHCRPNGAAEQIELDHWPTAVAELRQAMQAVAV